MLVTLSEIDAAAERIAGLAVPTSVRPVQSLSKLVGRPLWLAHEERQRAGSFKIRGAGNLIARLPGDTAGVVAASAGNHAQGVALAAATRAIPATIHMPEAAPLPKVMATLDYGAEVVLVPGDMGDALTSATDHAERDGLVLVPPFDHPDVIAGQGTLGRELAAALGTDVTTVVVPVGGGGLIAGVGAALAELRPELTVIGVEAEAMACMTASLAAGRPTRVTTVATMADGIAVPAPSALTLEHAEAHVDEVVTVSDEDVSRAVLLLLERAKSVVEPAGATSLAAVLAGTVAGAGPVCCVLSGGNVDPLLLTRLVEHGLTAAGRYVVVRVVLPDRPGELARLTALVAERGLNVVQVDHHRTGIDLPLDATEVRLTLETRDPDHRDEVVAMLGEHGFEVTRER